jgi:hypothetical protein
MARDINITRVGLPEDGENYRRFRIVNQNFEHLRDVIERLRLTNGLIDATAIEHGDLTGLTDDDHTAYHTDARALIWLGTRSTTDLPEGTNLYYTDARFDTRLATKNVLETIASVAAGDLVYYNGSTWTRLPVGAAGQVLTVAGGFPVWQAAAGGGGGAPPTDFDLLTDGVSSLIFSGGDVTWIIY